MSVFAKFSLPADCTHSAIDHVVGGFLPFMLAKIVDAVKSPVMFVARDGQSLDEIEQALQFIKADLTILQFPGWDCLPYDRVSPSQNVTARRIATLTHMANLRQKPEPALILTTVNACMQKLPPRAHFDGLMLELSPGSRLDMNSLTQNLSNHGFERVTTVRDVGEFAVRGGIVDLYAPGADAPLRLDFFGDTLESIRSFDAATQRSTHTHQSFTLHPMNEVTLTPERISLFRQNYIKNFGAAERGDALYEAISQGRRFAGQEHWLPLFYDEMETLLDHTGKVHMVLDHLVPEAMVERYTQVKEYYTARRNAGQEKQGSETAPYHPLPVEALYLAPQDWLENQAKWARRIDLTPFSTPLNLDIKTIDSNCREVRDFALERQTQAGNLFEIVVNYLAELRGEGRKILLACWSEGSVERLKQILDEHGLKKIEPVSSLALVKATPRDRMTIAVLPIEHGFISDDLVVVAEQDILGDRLIRAAKRRKRPANFITEAGSLNAGDIVVHVDHGIGRFVGLKTITAAGSPHDCLELHYAGEDRLFLPVENIELLSRYGGEGAEASLDKLGGVAWQARKARLKKRLFEIAGQLIDIAAKRQMRQAVRLTPPAGLYDEFVARFPYDETQDQLQAIEATLDDLAAGRPMDRLICGDVGFGKTEVALRAAFVAAMNGVQVAVVVPTTLLARQHYKNFCQRFAGLPLKIGHASRLVGARELAQVKAGLADGTVDIVIGTHALLGSAINFANLGLLIIDEEQHFGVKHKERLKELKSDIHVLTLSATPIPRTLQLALTGVRELSLIATPPVDRMAVRSFISPFDALTLRETLLREHYRGGLSFYVCPRISDLADIKAFLDAHVPELKVQVAHGQMPAAQLDDIMNAFYDGHYDVLLSTSIVESGLDIPTANTLVVHRADMFGLAALYQLRGRVGRSKQRAYALFTLPAGRLLTPQAERRLQVLQSLDTLGAGFQLASHDMDIRGAGNIVGEEQSGHIKEVGFELYQQMLEEAVAEMKEGGVVADSGWSPQITIGTSVMIPENYVPDLQLRMGLYRRIGTLEDRAEIDALAAEMIDRFGPLPGEVDHLLKIVHIKTLCRKANIEKMETGPKGVVVSFRNNNFANGVGLVEWIAAQGESAKIRDNKHVVFIRDWKNVENRLKGAHHIAAHLAELAQKI